MFLKLAQNYASLQTQNLQNQIRIATGEEGARPASFATLPVAAPAQPVFMDRKACLEFASGKIGKVLG
jgi:hypothetical protein